MNKDDFLVYLRALQAHDYDTFKQYYTQDYRAHFDGRTFDRDGVVEMERAIAAIADWTMEVLQIVADEGGIVIQAIMDMRFTKDAPPDFALGLRKAGDRLKTRFCGFYTLRDGKISEFRVFPFLGEQLD